MKNLNKMWKTIYYLVYTEGYEVLTVDDENNEVWLKHEAKKTVKRFINETPTHQEISFDHEKMMDRLDQLIAFVGFSFEELHIYYLTEKTIDFTEFNYSTRPKIKYSAIHKLNEYKNVSSHLVTKQQISKAKDAPTTTYKNKIFNASLVDKFMLKFSPFTYFLVLLNVIIWLFIVLVFRKDSQINLIDYGGLVHFNVVEGEWYRLLSHMFLHADFTHLLMNMFTLIIFGKLIEGALGSLKMGMIYFISGLFAGLLSLSIDTVSISIGASGGIFGLIGAFIVYLFTKKSVNNQFVVQTLIGIVILSLLTLFINNVNHFAHLGGFLGGAMVMYVMYKWRHNDKYKVHYLIGCIAISIILVITILVREKHYIYDELAKQAMYQGDFKKAEQIITQIKEKNYESDESYILSGLIISNNKSLNEAILEWEKGLKVFPESPALNYQLALGYRGKDDYKNANKFINNAMKYDKNNSKYKELKREISVFRS